LSILTIINLCFLSNLVILFFALDAWNFSECTIVLWMEAADGWRSGRRTLASMRLLCSTTQWVGIWVLGFGRRPEGGFGAAWDLERGSRGQTIGGPVCHAAVKPHALKPSQRPRRRTSRRRLLYLVYLSGFLCTGFLLFIIFLPASSSTHTHTHTLAHSNL